MTAWLPVFDKLLTSRLFDLTIYLLYAIVVNMTNIQDLLIGEFLKRSPKTPPAPSEWDGSIFEPIWELEIDERGAMGESIVASVLTESGCDVDYEPNKTGHGKDYDLISNGIKIEIKTACMGKNKPTFQHENINKNSHWDGIILFDIAPNKVYLICETHGEVPWDDLHRRKDSIYYKWDISRNYHEKNKNEIKSISDFFAKYMKMEKRIRKQKISS